MNNRCAVAVVALALAAGARGTGAATTLPHLSVQDGNLWFSLPRAGATVADALRSAGMTWQEDDLLIPDPATPLSDANRIFLARQRTVTLRVGTAEPRTVRTFRATVADVLADSNTVVSILDRSVPGRAEPVADGDTIRVTRIAEDVRTEEVPVAPPVITRNDPTLPLGTERVEDPGENGRRRRTARIRTENGREVSRTVLREEMTAKPKPRRLLRGTKRTVLASETGRASWYAGRPGTVAHRTLPFGSRLRVVRTDTGKSTIATVAGRGPFLPGRVVDLSRDVFRALAALSEGIISVRVERLP